eukprot:UN00609
MDIMDKVGDNSPNRLKRAREKQQKQCLDKQGGSLGRPYFSSGSEDLDHQMLRKSGGCRVWGEFNVKKLNGNFNFAMGKKIFMQGRHVHSFDIGSVGKWNITHKFHNLQFGPSFPGQENQLNSFSQILTKKP